MKTLRDGLSSAFRALPHFRGKSRAGVAIGRFLTDIEDDEDCIVTIRMRDGSLMRVDVRSRTEEWAYWTGDYDGEMISRLRTCLTPGCVVLDVGANVGFYSIALGKAVKALKGTLYAFEPVASNLKRIEQAVVLNGLERTVQPFNIALGDRNGVIKMFMEQDNRASTGNAIIITDHIADQLSQNVTARITKLDTFAEEQNIRSCHLIKIDVEGAEVMFLRGGIEFLSLHRPIIYGEFNAYWLKRFGGSFMEVVEILKPLEYRFFKQTERTEFVELSQPVDGDENVLLAPAETSTSVLRALGVVRFERASLALPCTDFVSSLPERSASTAARIDTRLQ
jgi:FkbM family methyltransferase